MGAAGTFTGVLTGNLGETEAEETDDLPDLLGLLEIVDPQTGQPKGVFTTDANGEIAFKVIPQPGQTKVVVTVGGQSFGVDLEEVVLTPAMTGAVDYYSFNSGSVGYQSTATLTVDFGAPATNPITWSIESVANSSAAWRRGVGDPHGLTWGQSADGTTDWSATPVAGSPPNSTTAHLTDVVGERAVVVKASTILNGVAVANVLTVNFGPGPLSVFRNVFFNNRPWSSTHLEPAFRMTASPHEGPQSCQPSWEDTVLLTTPPTIGVEYTSYPGPWVLKTDYAPIPFGYSTTSKLPEKMDLVAVARYDSGSNNYATPSKGAALAAGWDMAYKYWTGAIHWNLSSEYNALTIDLYSQIYNAISLNNSSGMAVVCLR
jgi:hypothetical protein